MLAIVYDCTLSGNNSAVNIDSRMAAPGRIEAVHFEPDRGHPPPIFGFQLSVPPDRNDHENPPRHNLSPVFAGTVAQGGSRYRPSSKSEAASVGGPLSMRSLRCRLLALFGHGAMSDLSPLSGEERKLDFGAVRSVDDPQRTLAARAI